jgi:hypothetical protein
VCPDPEHRLAPERRDVSKKTEREDRRARIEEMRLQQKRAERRRTLMIVGPAVLLVVVLIAVVGVLIFQEAQRQNDIEAAAKAPIQGVQSFDKLTRNHVETPVTYPQTPPVGGDHNPVWLNCGIYAAPVKNENAVHALEHGAVWVTYQPNLPAAQLDKLKTLARANNYMVLSPYEGIKSPVVASAWGKQLSLPNADDPRLEVFLRTYLQGKQTPEPGAACTGGTGTPEQ